MFKRFYNGSDEIALKEQSMAMFRELSSGVYHVIKDREDTHPEFVSSDVVVKALNYQTKIAVTGKSGMYANFELRK
jgi:hypothetical protein